MSSFSPSTPTKSWDMSRLQRLCQCRVRCRVTPQDLESSGISCETLAERVASIVWRNLDSGRAGRVMTDQSTGDLEEPALRAYVDRVADCYLQEHRRVEGLVAQDRAVWEQLYEQLARRAWNMLQGLQVPRARATVEAQDFAQETCEIIFSHRFPYDVPFDAWATCILRNRILQRHTRSRELMDRQSGIVSLDRPGSGGDADGVRNSFRLSLYDLLADASDGSPFERWEVWEWLLQAIGRLRSQDQQQVIVDTYFYELRDEEIAERMGKSKQAVYNLRHRALRNLKILLAKRKNGA